MRLPMSAGVGLRMRRLTLTLLLVLWSHLACAESFEYRIVNGAPFGQTTGWSGSKASACNALRDLNQAADPNANIIEWRVTGTENGCTMNRVVASTGEVVAQVAVGYEQRAAQGNECTAKSGQGGSEAFTVAWAPLRPEPQTTTRP